MNYPSVTLITPTADRQDVWPVCDRFASRCIDYYPGEIEWIVCDTCSNGTLPTMGTRQIHDTAGGCDTDSFIRNLQNGIKNASHDIVFFFEDDDYHSATFVLNTVRLFRNKTIQIVGECDAKYYHLGMPGWMQNSNTKHASLCQTAIRGDNAKQYALDILSTLNSYLFDMALWRGLSGKAIKRDSIWTIGLKGLTPHACLGGGHARSKYYVPDISGRVLDAWCGKQDAAWIRSLRDDIFQRHNLRCQYG